MNDDIRAGVAVPPGAGHLAGKVLQAVSRVLNGGEDRKSVPPVWSARPDQERL